MGLLAALTQESASRGLGGVRDCLHDRLAIGEPGELVAYDRAGLHHERGRCLTQPELVSENANLSFLCPVDGNEASATFICCGARFPKYFVVELSGRRVDHHDDRFIEL